MHRNTWYGDLPFIALLLAVVGLYYADLMGGRVLKTLHPDAMYVYMPVFANVSKIFSSGEFPYWLPNHLAGIPFYNATHFTALYPFYFFQWGLYQSPLECAIQINRVIGFHLLLLGVNAYIMMRLLSLQRFPALAGAVISACLPNVGVLASWVNIIAPLSWMPLAIAGIHLILETRRKKLGIVLATLALCMICLASPAQEFIYTLFILTGMFLLKSAILIRRKAFPELKQILVALSVAGGVSLCLTSPVVISVLTSQKDMIRFAGAHAPVIGYERFAMEAILEGQMAPLELLSCLFWPGGRQPVTGDPYLGVVPIALMCVACRRIKTQPFLWPFLFFTAYGLLSATGEHLGIAVVNHHLPLLNKIREADRHLVLTALTAPVLAAFGLDAIIAETRNGSLKRLVKTHAVVLLAVLALILMSIAAGLSIHKDLPYAKGILSLIGCALLLPALKRFPAGAYRVVWAAFFGVALLFPVLVTPLWAAFPIQQESCMGVGLYANKENQESIAILSQIKEISQDKNDRFVYRTRDMEPFKWAMNGAYFGLRSFESFFQPLPVNQHNDFIGRKHCLNYLRLWGGRYWIWEKGLAPPPGGFSLIQSYDRVNLYVADNALPHCFLVDEVGGFYSSTDDYFQKIEADVDFYRHCYVEQNAFAMVKQWLERDGNKNPVLEVLPIESSANTFTYRIMSNKPAILVLNEYFGENWKVRVDGKPCTPFKVNLNQVGLQVNEGIHQVEYEYRPQVFSTLLAGSKIVWILGSMCVLILFAFRRDPSSRSGGQDSG